MKILIFDAAVLCTFGSNLLRGSGAVEGAVNLPVAVRRRLADASSNKLIKYKSKIWLHSPDGIWLSSEIVDEFITADNGCVTGCWVLYLESGTPNIDGSSKKKKKLSDFKDIYFYNQISKTI